MWSLLSMVMVMIGRLMAQAERIQRQGQAHRDDRGRHRDPPCFPCSASGGTPADRGSRRDRRDLNVLAPRYRLGHP